MTDSNPPEIPDEILKLLDHAATTGKHMDNDLVYRVIKWNRDRGLLDSFNPDLEVQMLTEEANEFFRADNIVGRLDAFADFDFVWEGTQAKFGAMQTRVLESLVKRTGEFLNIQAWHGVVYDMMFRLLVDELAPYADPEDPSVEVANLLIDIFQIVVEANELKGTGKIKGKVQKGKDWSDPAPLIKECLNKWIEERCEG